MQNFVIALGFFDGVHLGHAALLKRARKIADEQNYLALALTFDTHPLEQITGQRMPLIQTKAERERLMKEKFHMDEVRFLPFNQDMMEKSWECFLDEVLIKELHAAHLVCGYDYRFGYHGEGTPELLQKACEARGIGCDIIDPIELDGQTISSTLIRQQIQMGAIDQAIKFLGHPYCISGVVVHGKGIGNTIGIPTANICVPKDILMPAKGVYISSVYTTVGVLPSVTNIGVCPTVNGEEVSIESWILDYSGNLYGQEIRLELWQYIRPERKFDTFSELSAEINNDALVARAYFLGHAVEESEEQK